jgi:hypothetical protein
MILQISLFCHVVPKIIIQPLNHIQYIVHQSLISPDFNPVFSLEPDFIIPQDDSKKQDSKTKWGVIKKMRL